MKASIVAAAIAVSSLAVAPADNKVNAVENIDKVLAFPGAEGGGRYTSGGRFGEVYIVNTLEDYGTGEKAIQGSLRDAVSKDNRFIVFNISGNINLKEPLSLRKRKM